MVAELTLNEVGGITLREIIYQKHHRVEGAAWITINRPERRNATTKRTWREIETVIEDADKDPEVGVIVLTGQGEKAFCAGGDIGEHPDEEAGRMAGPEGKQQQQNECAGRSRYHVGPG